MVSPCVIESPQDTALMTLGSCKVSRRLIRGRPDYLGCCTPLRQEFWWFLVSRASSNDRGSLVGVEGEGERLSIGTGWSYRHGRCGSGWCLDSPGTQKP